jgi:hypothetical protein
VDALRPDVAHDPDGGVIMHAIDPNDLSSDTLWTIIWIVGLLMAIAVGSLLYRAK